MLGRLTLPPIEVAALLDLGLAVPIGVEADGRIVHRLFFSELDRQCFVAVQDRDGSVITVVPLDYHQTLAWPVSLAAQDQARRLAADYEHTRRDGTTARASATTPRFRFLALVRTRARRVRWTYLGSWPANPYGGSFWRLIEDGAAIVALQHRLGVQIEPGEAAEAVYGRLGEAGRPFRLRCMG
ncbi:MAG: hypothetical protein AABZ30_06720 [Myxococcota bacterium]